MKTIARRHLPGKAFTLIELLVVVSVIAILAGLLFAVMPQISIKRSKAVARSEMFQIQAAIEAYKSRYGFYPPDGNPPVGVVNGYPLYFELVGSIRNAAGDYTTLDGSGKLRAANVNPNTGVNAFVNSSASAAGGDDGAKPEAFLKDLKPAQIGSNGLARILVCSEGARWIYNSSHPTNNPSSYDLWVDLPLGGKTYRISNWSKEPQVF